MSYQKDRDEFVAQITAEVIAASGWPKMATSADGLELARLILRNAATMQRLAEVACNRELTKREQRQDAACQARIEQACEPWGIKPNFQGDPRGAVVKLLLPSGRYNSWGGRESGYCVPTR